MPDHTMPRKSRGEYSAERRMQGGAFCQHNIRCFRPILTGRGRREDKRPKQKRGNIL